MGGSPHVAARRGPGGAGPPALAVRLHRAAPELPHQSIVIRRIAPEAQRMVDSPGSLCTVLPVECVHDCCTMFVLLPVVYPESGPPREFWEHVFHRDNTIIRATELYAAVLIAREGSVIDPPM